MKATIGRIVHFVLPDGKGADAERAAIIIRTWSDTCVNLHVFSDGANDHGTCLANGGWVTSVTQDENKGPRTWHWPEREDVPQNTGVIGPSFMGLPLEDRQPKPIAETVAIPSAPATEEPGPGPADN